jgi:hypothetical protein
MSSNKVDYLIGVYHHFDPFPEEERGAAYYILHLLDQRGLLEKDEAIKIFQSKYKTEIFHSKWIGPFESLDTLNQFAFFLCEKLDAQKINLLSVQEYNNLLETTVLAADFHRDLLVKGNVLENIDKKEKGFFSRFFS